MNAARGVPETRIGVRPHGAAHSVAVVLFAFVLSSCTTPSGTVAPPPGTVVPTYQSARLLMYNVVFGATVGGIGAWVNGKGGAGRRVVRGALRGALGGSLLYAGKWTAGQIGASETLVYGWPAAIVHETGASIIENAAYDRPPLARLSLFVAFVRLDVIPTSGSLRARLLPLNAVAFAWMAAQHRFEVGRSLRYGAPFFSGPDPTAAPLGIIGPATGFAFLNTVYLSRSDGAFYDTAAHELVHLMQHREYLRTAALYAPLDRRFQRSDLYRRLARWIYLDNPGPQAAVYFGVEGGAIAYPCKYNNWLEWEAEAFGRRRPVGVCP